MKQECSENQEFSKKLLEWFRANRRILPWREEPTPYRVWISEIMLQQTRVATVMPYFERFMKELPNVAALAEVEESKLLKLWEGLGYYNRARNLQKAAQMIQKEYGGRIPDQLDALLTLSGIGEYTAGAVASIAYGRDETAVDGNVLRVFSRVYKIEEDIMLPATRKKIAQLVKECLPKGSAGEYNQSLMELGATICLPNGAPKCNECPVRDMCQARKSGNMLDYPKKAPKKKRRIEEKTILVLQDEEYIAVRKRPEKGLLAGMYEFPWAEGFLNEEEVIQFVKDLGLNPLHVKALPESKHIFTHIEWHMMGFAVRLDELTGPEKAFETTGIQFVEKRKMESEIPIPSAFAAYTKYYDIKLGNARFE